MKSILLVAAGGAIGAVIRYLISVYLKQNYSYSFPWHTFFINITGCLLIGLFFALSEQSSAFDNMRLFVMVGILGGYTTFSSFGLETFSLIQTKHYYQATIYVLGSNFFGLAGVIAGYFTVNLFRS